MATRPSTKDASLTFDVQQINADVAFIASFDGDLTSAMQSLISQRQAQSAHLHLNPAAVAQLGGYPRFTQLQDLALHGARPIMHEGFTPNRGVNEESLRPQYFYLRDAIHHHLAKLQRQCEALVLPKAMLMGWSYLHANATHVVLKPSDSKGRICSDPRSSGLNEGTNLAALYDEIGPLKLPTLRDLARSVVAAKDRGDIYLSKFDVSAAFNKYKLHWSLVGLLAYEVEEYFVLPLVGIFGWSACPAYYDLISKAVDWALSGGVSFQQLDVWRRQLALSPVHRQECSTATARLQWRSSTYVDDTTVFSSEASVAMDHADVLTVIKFLMGESAVNEDKTEGPSLQLESIGWHVDMTTASIRPSHKGLCKLCYYVLRAVPPSRRSIPVDLLHSMIGVLRHYATVMPILYGSLNHLQRQLVAAQNSPALPRFINLNASSRRELDLWRLMMLTGLRNPGIWTCPALFLQHRSVGDADFIAYTDASTTIGGGYIIQGLSFGHWAWSDSEHQFFSAYPTHINVLELATVVMAIVENALTLSSKTVLVFVDNTNAVSWVNALRSSSPEAQPWIRLLVLTCVSFNIHTCATHIPGVDNVTADGLSRNVQEVITRVGQTGLLRPAGMTQTCRMKVFQTTYSTNGSLELWSQALNLLTDLGLTPSEPSVRNSILTLLSQRSPNCPMSAC